MTERFECWIVEWNRNCYQALPEKWVLATDEDMRYAFDSLEAAQAAIPVGLWKAFRVTRYIEVTQ